jgi:GNAT superfamily N-acetyltransferase
MKPHFEIAEANDAQVLTSISISAFHNDFEKAGRSTKGGPPGYDSVEFHKKMIEEAIKFFKIVVDKTPIGAFWFYRDNANDVYLYRLFVDPQYHRKGIGIQLFDFLFKMIPDTKTWKLKVPIWNTRTPKFYQKVGFRIVDRSDRFLFFEKRIET